jgi:hypothetical protein
MQRTNNKVDMDGTTPVQRGPYPETKVEKIRDKNESISSNDEWITGTDSSTTASDSDNDADNDADNDIGNSKKDIPMQNFLRKLNATLPAPTAPVEEGHATGNAYDCREFARTIRGNWKIIAPTLAAASAVAGLALLTIGARGSVSGTELSFNQRWGAWASGYLMTQVSILIGSYCIPSFQCR